jgi:hypothetical protein
VSPLQQLPALYSTKITEPNQYLKFLIALVILQCNNGGLYVWWFFGSKNHVMGPNIKWFFCEYVIPQMLQEIDSKYEKKA